MDLNKFIIINLVILILGVLLVNSSCPLNCSNNGYCSGNKCNCNNGFFGIDCSIEGKLLVDGTTDEETLDEKTWFYYKVVTDKNYNKFSIDVREIDSDSDCDIYVQFDRLPSRSSYDYKDITRQHEYSIEIYDTDIGDYYIGIYGFYHCSYQIYISLTQTPQCPNDCSGHGSCLNDETCDCDTSFYGNDCSSNVLSFNLHSSYQATVEYMDWDYYSYEFVSNGEQGSPLLTFSVQELSNGDSDMYINFNSFPDFLHFNYRNSGLDDNYQLSISDPQEGVYYIGILGYTECEYVISIDVDYSVSCTSECSDHGICDIYDNCSCENGFVGDECETYSPNIQTDAEYHGKVVNNNWNYYHISGESAANLVFHFSQAHGGRCDVLINSGENPDFFNFVKQEIGIDENFDIVIENPQGQNWFVGIFGYSSCEYNFFAEFNYNECPNGCSNHGFCNFATGRCNCGNGYSGEDCGSPIYPLQSGTLESGYINFNKWIYYRYQVPPFHSSLTIELKETNSTGFINIFVNRGTTPDLENYQDSDQNQTLYHNIYFETDGGENQSDRNYYIGVFGTSYIPVGSSAGFSIVAYSPPI